uniref:Uncharacterized protein n=1 Tax=Arundo donax TaxID=35708 RepID=A0A0A9C345_ARUDO
MHQSTLPCHLCTRSFSALSEFN